MKNTILLLLILLFSQYLHAQLSDTMAVQLPDVEIQGNRINLPFSETSRSVQVITKAELEAAPVVSVTELLRYVSGVDVRQRGVHGVQADVSIRGGTFDQTLILVNGIKMVDPQTGHHSMNLPVDLQNIERIEVLKGPGARIYGQNAFAGAINIITKVPDEQEATISLTAGENTLGGVRMGVALPKENFKQYFSFSRDFSEGYRYNTDYNITNFFYQSQANINNQKLNILAGFTERAFGANGFYASPANTDQYEEVQTSLVAAEYQHVQGKWIVKPRLYWRRNQDEYIFVRSNPSIYRNLHIGNMVGLEVNSSYSSKLGTTGFGLDVNQNLLQSNLLGEWNRTAVSFFAEHRFLLFDALDVTPGVLFNYFSDFDANLLPGVDVGLRLSENFKVFGNVGYTYRVPTYTDLYYQDQANIGNPDLQPESAITYEAGFNYLSRGLHVQTSIFRRDGRDNIDWVKSAEEDPWQPRNFASIDFQGVETSLEVLFPNLLGSDFWLRRFDISYTYLEADLATGDLPFSRYALDNLRHQFIAGIEHRIFSNLYHSSRLRYNDRVNLDDYMLLDTRLFWQGNCINAFLEASNLLDEDYTETNLVPMPGRWVRAGVTFRFDY